MVNINTADSHIARVISYLDRNPLSDTYGSFQRDFWHYKMAADFPCATYQSAVFSLLLVYSDRESFFYNKDYVLEYIKAGIVYWQSIQHSDGSFSEWYPNERSIVATAFTLWFVTETYLELKDFNLIDTVSLHKTILKAVSFLHKNIDALVINHTAGAIAAIYNAYLITGDKSCLAALEDNKGMLLSKQSPEGWFCEYGNPDAGYQSLSIFFLASYYKKSKDEAVYLSLERGIDFISSFVHPDQSIGGTYLSRNTDYLFRYGLILASEYFPKADYVLSNVMRAKTVNEKVVDDRYFIFFFLPDFLLSLKEIKKNIPYEQKDIFFKEAGVLIKSAGDFSLFCNLMKGGACKVFKKDQLVFSSCGYLYKENDVLFSTHGYGFSTYSYLDENTTSIKLNVSFYKVQNKNYGAFFLLLFRLFNLIFCRFSFIDIKFSNFLKKYKILKTVKAKGVLHRELTLTEKGVELRDIIKGVPDADICHHVSESFLTFVPSSSYFSFRNNMALDDLFSSNVILDNDNLIYERNIF